MIEKHVKDYLHKLVYARDGFILQLEKHAREKEIPIMDLLGMETVLQILRLFQPKRILEIGTAIGYSAIRMAEAIPDAVIVTIEKDEQRYEEARKNIAVRGLSGRIRVMCADALEAAYELENEPRFDVLFIDAAKSKYKMFFETFAPLLNERAVVISDNVLFRGYVCQDFAENKRLKKIVEKIAQYNDWLVSHPDFITTILPIGDGIAISIKK